jgi:type I restriction enzyme S subunit
MNKIEYIPLTKVLEKIVDNRGKSVPTVLEGFPLIATNCIKESSIYPTFENIRFVDDFTLKNWFRAHLAPNDILFVNKGTPGRVCLVPNPVTFCAAQDMIGFRADKSKINYKYLFTVLRSNWVKQKIQNYHVGLVIPHFKKQDLDSILIPEKTPIEQEFIGNLYIGLSEKIELNNKINQELEAMVKLLFNYWFVQFDFPNKQGKPYKSSGGKMVYNAELKREIPEGWEVKKLGKLIIKYTDKSIHIESKNILNKGKYPVITQDNGDFISGFTNEENPIEDVPLIIFGDHSCTLRYIDFSFFRGADGTQIMSFGKDLTIYVYIYLQCIIKQIPGYGKYERHYKYLKEFDVIVPESQYLNNFQLISKPIFDKISQSRLENQHLSELRDWLLPMLMNGQVTVKEAEEKLSMAAEPNVEYKKG